MLVVLFLIIFSIAGMEEELDVKGCLESCECLSLGSSAVDSLLTKPVSLSQKEFDALIALLYGYSYCSTYSMFVPQKGTLRDMLIISIKKVENENVSLEEILSGLQGEQDKLQMQPKDGWGDDYQREIRLVANMMRVIRLLYKQKHAKDIFREFSEK